MFTSGESLVDFVSPALDSNQAANVLPLFNGRFPAGRKTTGDEYDIHVVSTIGQRNLACELLNRMYGWRGYGTNHSLCPDDHFSTFAATVNDEIVATLTLTVDSAEGLAVEQTFGDVIEEARAVAGSRLCELTKFASQPSVDSKHLLAHLFHTIFIYGSERHGCTDLFIEVNPRHIRFYETMLGFARIGELRVNEAVNAPSQLMRLKVADIARYIDLYAGFEETKAARSLYPFFFSRDEEEKVRAKVVENLPEDWSAQPGRGALRRAPMGRFSSVDREMAA
jgi:hypothetical protein